MIGSLRVILANAVTLILSLLIMALKVRYSLPGRVREDDPGLP
jgi:uncharacterized protein with PQ loop repeat